MSDARPEHSAGETAAEPAETAPPPAASPDDAPPAAAPPRHSAAGPALAAASGALAVLLAGVATSPYWAPDVARLLPWSGAPGFSDAAAREQLSVLGRRLAAIEQRPTAVLAPDAAAVARLADRVATLEQRPAPAASDSSGAGDVAALREAVQHQAADAKALADRVAALEAKPAAAPADPAALQAVQGGLDTLGATVRGLAERVASLAAARGTARRDEALVLALGQLRQAMAGSGPFPEPLAAAAALTADRPDIKAALDQLGPAAAQGVPSLAVLRERFARIAGAVANADAADAPGWGERILGTLRAAVGLRRVGAAASGGGAEAAVATAEGALAGDDLAGAVVALTPLTAAAAAAAKPWLAAAQARLDADAALAAASDAATARLAQAPGKAD